MFLDLFCQKIYKILYLVDGKKVKQSSPYKVKTGQEIGIDFDNLRKKYEQELVKKESLRVKLFLKKVSLNIVYEEQGLSCVEQAGRVCCSSWYRS
jgi:hypothetical protein